MRRPLACCFTSLIIVGSLGSVASAAGFSTRDTGKTIAGISFFQSCGYGVAYGRATQFKFIVENLRHQTLSFRVDIYLGGGARVLGNPRFDNPATAVYKVVGGHAWTTWTLKGANANGSYAIDWEPTVLVPRSAPKPWKVRIVASVAGKSYTYLPVCGAPTQ
jgi:hypothetical protein